MKKDVLFMCQFFYPEYVSSALLPYQTAIGLKTAGLKVDAICGYPKEYLGSEKKIANKECINGINIYRKKYIQVGRRGFIGRLINYFSFTLIMLLNIFKCRQYKVIIVYSNPPILPLVSLLAKRLFKCKIIFVAYDLYPEIGERTGSLKSSGIVSMVMRKINKSLYKNTSRVIALSSEMKNFISNNRKISEEKITVIPNWATEKMGDSKVNNEKFRLLKKQYDLIISYFGNMGTAQDMETIKKVMRNSKITSKNIIFLFAGHGNKKADLQSFVKKNKLKNCVIFDYLNGQDFIDAKNVTDVFIVSLEKGLAGLAVPSKTYSYYQSGKPVIAIMDKKTDISKEIKDFNAGYSINNLQSDELTEWIIQLYQKPDLIKPLISNVKKLYEKNYKKNIQIDKYIQEVTKVLEE